MYLMIEVLKRKKNAHLNTDITERIPDKIINMRTYKGKNRYLISRNGSNVYEDIWVDEGQILNKQLFQ